MAKRRKRRKHANRGRARKFNRARKSSRRKMHNKKRRSGKRRVSGAVKKRGAFVKMMWKKHNAKFRAMLKKKGGFGKVSREINAAYKG